MAVLLRIAKRLVRRAWLGQAEVDAARRADMEEVTIMSFLDSILGQLGNNPTVDGLAAKVGLSPEQVEQAVQALGQQTQQPGDTVQGAADQTGLPQDKLQQVLGHLGGEGGLGSIAGMLGQGGDEGGGLGGMLGGLFGKE